jgi:hypothetical protein
MQKNTNDYRPVKLVYFFPLMWFLSLDPGDVTCSGIPVVKGHQMGSLRTEN